MFSAVNPSAATQEQLTYSFFTSGLESGYVELQFVSVFGA